MNMLELKVIEKIRREGPLTFECFMEMALYDEEFGYYMREATRIGREGDFYTGSHLHPEFGISIGRQIEEMWEVIGRPANFSIVEMGAGEGYVCGDMLGGLKNSDFFDSLDYNIIERNPAMRARQKKALHRFSHKIKWFSTINDLSGITGCIFSNELLDAFPVHIVQMESGLKEVYVTVDDDVIKEVLGPPGTNDLEEYFRENSVGLQEGYRTEVNLRVRQWLEDVSNSLARGFVMTIDYGYSSRDYYFQDRNRGTLVCYHRHQVNEDPCRFIGEQDISTHVNFTSVKKWGEQFGLNTIGFCSQSAFLISLGITEAIERLAATSADYLFELARIKKLILPQGMGESHQVLVQVKGDNDLKLKGFTMKNKVEYLDRRPEAYL